MADDIVISGDNEDRGESAANKLHREIEKIGLRVNTAKWERNGRQADCDFMMVHSLNVAAGRLELSELQIERASNTAARSVGACRSMQLSSFAAAIKYRNQLHGWYYYARQTHDPITSRLRAAIHESDQHAKRVLQQSGITVKNWKWWVYPYCDEVKRNWSSRYVRRILDDELKVEEIEPATCLS